MAGSFSFDGTNLGTSYGCYIENREARPLLPDIMTQVAPLADDTGVIDLGSQYGPRIFTLPVRVVGTSRSDLLSKLDSIAALLDVSQGLKQIIFDDQTGRYFLGKLQRISGERFSVFTKRMVLTFFCPKAFAYNTSEDANPHTLDADPKTVTESNGGSAVAKPVWRITPSAAVSGQVKLENVTRSEEIIWSGDLDGAGDYIEVNADTMIVYKNTAIDMSPVSGYPPRLSAGANSIKVTGVPTGILLVTYRDRYL